MSPTSADDLYTAITDEFCRVVPGIDGTELELDADMVDRYGLTSLNKVVFLSSACTTTGVSLAAFTEQDLAELRTLADVAAALRARRGDADVTP
jgi:hypothetical protein